MLLIHILLYNLLTLSFLFMLIRINPRLMMQDYPEEITAGLPPRTRKEKKKAILLGLPFLLTLVGYPLGLGIYLKFSLTWPFLKLWAALFILMMSFNLVDLLIADWLIFCLITPRFIQLPGTEGHPGYKNYGYHFIAFLKGCMFSVLGSLLFAGVIQGCRRY